MNIEYYLNRGKELIANWNSYLEGDESVRGIYNLEYLAVSIVQTFMRIERYCETFDKGTNEWKNIIPQFIQTHHDLLVVNALKGADPRATHALMKNTINEIDFLFFERKDKDLDTDLFEQLTDCLVQRDDLYLVEQFLSHERRLLSEDCISSFQEYWNTFSKDIKYLDEDIEINLDVFLLISSFCEEYISFNGLKGESTYWWLFQPIQRAMELKVTSLLSVIDLLKQKKASQQAEEISTSLNALVDIERLPDEEKLPTNILPFPSIKSGHIEIQNPPREYALAASAETSTILDKAIYVLVVRNINNVPEHHKVVGITEKVKSASIGLGPIIQRIIDQIPDIAKAYLKLSPRDFSLQLQTTWEDCEGESIGLAAFLEYLNATKYLEAKQRIAASGRLEFNGNVRSVTNAKEKAMHALSQEFDLILFPRENENEISTVTDGNNRFHFIDNVKEAYQLLQLRDTTNIQASNNLAWIAIENIRGLLSANGFVTTESKEGQYHYFFDVSGFGETIKVLLHFDKNKNPKKPMIQGNQKNKLYTEIQSIILGNKDNEQIVEITGAQRSAKASIKDPVTRERIKSFLLKSFDDSATLQDEKGCDYRLDIINSANIIIKQYSSGTLYILGVESTLWNNVISSIESIIGEKQLISTSEERTHTSDIKNPLSPPSDVKSWIGVDESGKGDYFGPLVTAAVMVDDNVLIDLSKLNIRDSKDLSDSQNINMGETILEICKDKCYVLTTMPEKYNELMEGTSFQSNSQKLLAWQHRRALENILQKYECAYAICDQFGPEYLIKEGLKTGKGQNITIIQRPKAEKDIAVAAASILARREFLLRLHKMSAEYKVAFPKGSSDLKSIILVAEGLIRSYGRDVLRKTAKLHFKTTKSILEKISNE